MGDWDHALAQMEKNPHPTPATLPQFVAGLNVLMNLLSVEGDLSRRRLKAEIIDQYTRRAEAAVHGTSAVSSGASAGAATQPKIVNSDAWRALKTKAVCTYELMPSWFSMRVLKKSDELKNEIELNLVVLNV